MKSLAYFDARLSRIEYLLGAPLLSPFEAYALYMQLQELRAELFDLKIQVNIREQRERLGDDGYLERARVQRAMAAMQNIQYLKPAKVRSRDGMVRLMRAAYGKDTRVRWSWPPVARAQEARPIFV